MRAFPPAPPGAVRLTVDEGALVVGLLDFLVEPEMRASPDVIGLAQRTRRRVSAALADAINSSPTDLDARFERLWDELSELQAVARETRSLVGDSGPLTMSADDDRVRSLRQALAHVAA